MRIPGLLVCVYVAGLLAGCGPGKVEMPDAKVDSPDFPSGGPAKGNKGAKGNK